MSHSRETYAQMRADFNVAMRWFKLPPEVQRTAWQSACLRESTAAACYRAIVRSIGDEIPTNQN